MISPRLSSRVRASLTAMLVAVSASGLAQTVDNKPEVKTQVLTRVNDILTKKAYVPGVDFSKWPSYIDAQKAKLDAAKDDDAFDIAVSEAITKFGASHIYLLTPKVQTVQTQQKMVGIGVTQQRLPDGGLFIVRTVPKAPAATAGIVPGDTITHVNGKPAEGTKGIAGPEGSVVVLTVKHRNGKSQDYKVTRRTFSTVQPEELTEVDKETAKLTVPTFNTGYDKKNVETLMKRAAGYKNLILDLRNNPGGRVTNLQHLLGLLIPSDEVVGTFVDKDMVNDYVKSTEGQPSEVVKIAEWSRHNPDYTDSQIHPSRNANVPVYKGQLVVLVNPFSGSASEICAAALREVAGASVVGQKSAGAVLVSQIWSATNGFALEFPTMDYVTVRGTRLEGTGVVPDVDTGEVKYVLPDEPDVAVQKAQDLFARTRLREERGLTGSGR